MNVLFIQGGTRAKKDKNNNWYTDNNFTEKIWERYMSYCDKLTVILRKEEKVYEENYAKSHFNKISSNIDFIPVKDVYRPKENYFNFKLKKEIENTIEKQIKKNDFVIIRSIVNFYTITAIKICRKLDKRYLVEVTGIAFDSLWNHGDLYGKIVAIPAELNKKRYLKNAPYALYVTNKTLQQRYCCKGKTIGCSDVEIKRVTKTIEERRKRHIENSKFNDKIILGTLAFLNSKIKRQEDVIKALGKLKKEGITNFEYQLVGGGDKEYLYNIAKKNNVENQVVFLGLVPHDEVFNWLDTIDIYIQPSCTEGLSRAIIEAMSRGCTIVSSNAGGNLELTSKGNVFKTKSVKQISNILKKVDKEFIDKESKISFKRAKKYEKEILDRKRDEFYKKAINEK